jgi:HlyD family secretion protein
MSANRRGFNWGKWIVLLLVIAGAGGGWFFYRAKMKEAPVKLKTAKVATGDIVQAVTANGALNAVTNVQVGSQISGIIQSLSVDFNSHVTNGQVIAVIDPQTYEQNVTSAKADLANANAALEYAQVNFNRAKELRTAELISPSDYDKTVADLHQAQAVVDTRVASLKKAQLDLDRTTITAPVDGIVISRAVDVGQTVAASFSTPTLFQIANDLRKMRIEAMVSEADVGGVDEGQRVTFTVDAFPGRQFRGEVSQVRFAPITNQNVVSYTCIVDVNNADLKLRPGMTATASIITGEKKGVLRIPNAALRFKPSEDLLPKSARTNSPAGANPGSRMMAQAGGAGASSVGGEGGDRPNREEWRKRMESMSPEEREQMRQRFRERGGGGPGGPGGPGGFGGGGGQRRGSDVPMSRTIYVVDKEQPQGEKPVLKPITIKTGIADNSYTEVVEGLKENDEIVTGIVTPIAASAASQAPQGRSPFGGGGFGGGRR